MLGNPNHTYFLFGLIIHRMISCLSVMFRFWGSWFLLNIFIRKIILYPPYPVFSRWILRSDPRSHLFRYLGAGCRTPLSPLFYSRSIPLFTTASSQPLNHVHEQYAYTTTTHENHFSSHFSSSLFFYYYPPIILFPDKRAPMLKHNKMWLWPNWHHKRTEHLLWMNRRTCFINNSEWHQGVVKPVSRIPTKQISL